MAQSNPGGPNNKLNPAKVWNPNNPKALGFVPCPNNSNKPWLPLLGKPPNLEKKPNQ